MSQLFSPTFARTEENMSESSRNERVDELIARLLINRNARDENELCHEARLLSDDEKLEVVRSLAVFNVRLSATVAARVHLAERQQVLLMRELLDGGGSNAIKQFVGFLFSRRLSASLVLSELVMVRDKNPDAVRLMAYYFSGALPSKDVRLKYEFSKLRAGLWA